ncbi:MAG TPA: prephenate dehydrogenase/arogenate dehydrogenase family protein [Candidatus Limnocylindrales bacterium]|nr:prephenate dehydrogenase/arogenate dehydrogenase family protein [Candidatus Limnocylindrales bacterium]
MTTANTSSSHSQIQEDPAMQIAIIGAGNVGRALATSLTRAGHDVTITAEHPENAAAVATETGATAGTSNAEAASAADLVVLAVPAQSIGQIAGAMGSSLDGKVVIDVSNRPTPTPDGTPTSIAEELQVSLPGARVVKAFNTVFASRQADPQVAGIAPDGFVAGDDASAKQTVLDVVESLGFRPVDAGSLASARTLEGMAWLNIQRNLAGGTWQDAWVLVGPETLVADADSRN